MEKQQIKENNSNNNSLMKKTKAQLVEIIFRKDNVQVELNDKIKCLEKNVTDVTNRLTSAYKDMEGTEQHIINTCKERDYFKVEFENKCDELVTLEEEHKNCIREFKNKINMYRLLSLLLAAFAITCLIVGYIE